MSALEKQAERVVRENELVKEEAMLQELRHLAPCKADLEVGLTLTLTLTPPLTLPPPQPPTPNLTPNRNPP